MPNLSRGKAYQQRGGSPIERCQESLLRVDAARTVNELISAISMALDIDDGVKLYHGWRVAIIAANLAKSMGRVNVAEAFYGGLLHDVGGVGLPHHVVSYLTEQSARRQHNERIVDPAVISHPLLSAEIVSSLPGISHAARAVLDHHEDWDGHGFPRALHDTEIGLDAQILHAADTADLMLRDNPQPTLDDLLGRIGRNASVTLSAEAADCLIEALRDGLYNGLVDTNALMWLFDSTRLRVGSIPVERGVDAIGVTLDVLSRVVDNKHPYTIGHSRRVARYALLIGIALGLEHDELTLLKWATLVHDVGKLSVPNHMLDKPCALLPEEFEVIKFHVSYTFDIVSMITDLRPVATVASSHHEHFDGTGYPLGWSGDDIPLGARIIAVADAFDAMTSRRPYRLINDVVAACRELEKKAGTQFDPEVVRIAIPVLRNLGLIVIDA